MQGEKEVTKTVEGLEQNGRGGILVRNILIYINKFIL
jgi:hypothetical protein